MFASKTALLEGETDIGSPSAGVYGLLLAWAWQGRLPKKQKLPMDVMTGNLGALRYWALSQLISEAESQFHRGLTPEFSSVNLVTPCVRGRVNLWETEIRQHLLRGRVACQFDVITFNHGYARRLLGFFHEMLLKNSYREFFPQIRRLTKHLEQAGVSRSSGPVPKWGENQRQRQQQRATPPWHHYLEFAEEAFQNSSSLRISTNSTDAPSRKNQALWLNLLSRALAEMVSVESLERAKILPLRLGQMADSGNKFRQFAQVSLRLVSGQALDIMVVRQPVADGSPIRAIHFENPLVINEASRGRRRRAELRYSWDPAHGVRRDKGGEGPLNWDLHFSSPLETFRSELKKITKEVWEQLLQT